MREIKFRGKSDDDGKWYYGLPYFTKDRMKSQIRYDISTKGCCSADVIPETISEFTGLKDKNGIEIYEGDIVNAQYFENIRVWEWLEVEQIVFNDGAFMLKTKFDDIEFYRPLMTYFKGIKLLSLEVIGNIHENKELLEVE